MRIKKRELIIVIPFVFLLFQQAIIRNTTGMGNKIVSFVDEAYVAMLVLYCLWKKKGEISFRTREGYGIFWSWTVFLISGVLSSIVWRYQSFAGALVDAFICSKFVLVLYCFCTLYDMKSVAEGVQKTLYRLTKGIVVILFTLTVINCMVPIFPKSDFRFFTYGIQLFFGHATFYAAASLTAVATIISGSEKKNGKDDIYIYMGLFCMFMSLRTKAVVAAIAVLFLYVYIVKLKKRNVYLALIMAAIVVLAMGFDQISFYYGGNYLTDDNFVRERMLWDSFNIAKNHFPLGAGFATFGSEMARKNFSPLYTMYGYKTDKFLNDTFWPIIIAQNGWIGLLAFFGILFFMMRYLIRYGRKMPSLFCSCLSIIAYLMICSAGESAFFHPVSCPMFIVFSLNVINMNHQKQIKNIVV